MVIILAGFAGTVVGGVILLLIVRAAVKAAVGRGMNL